jgi:hypothetical protein
MSLCVLLNVTRQGLGKHVAAATNTHATIEDLLEEVFPMRSVSYQILSMAGK